MPQQVLWEKNELSPCGDRYWGSPLDYFSRQAVMLVPKETDLKKSSIIMASEN